MLEVVNSLESLFPPFAEQLIKLDKLVNLARFYHYETYRSFARQLELFSQGRQNIGGIWSVVDQKKIVTNAKPGLSFHAYGLAADYPVDGNSQKQGIQWDWDDYDETLPGKQPIPWNILGKAAADLGIEWAGTWKTFKEMPHVQNRFMFNISELYPILVNDGIEAVWKKIIVKVKPDATSIVVPQLIKDKDEIESTTAHTNIVTEDDLNKITNTTTTEAKSKGFFQLLLEAFSALFSK